MRAPQTHPLALLTEVGFASAVDRNSSRTCRWKKPSFVVSILILGVSMNACSMLGSTTTWKEEVLLHDGTRMIVTRSQTRSGAGEIGQGPPITEHSVTFTPMGSNQSITWKSESTKVSHAAFDLLALDVVKGTPYIATSLNGCSLYELWGRPNPPYVFFKYLGQQWRQIPLQEFPAEIKQPNVLISIYGMEEIRVAEKEAGFVPTVAIKRMNGGLRQQEYKSIHREPIVRTGKSASLVDCPIPTGPDGLPISSGAKSEMK